MRAYRALNPYRFMERHRRLLNAYIAPRPSLLDTSFSALLSRPRLIDFKNKSLYFRHRLNALSGGSRAHAHLKLAVHRNSVFVDSFHKLKSRSAAEMRGTLQVRFAGEDGVDMGGVTREWFQVRPACFAHLFGGGF